MPLILILTPLLFGLSFLSGMLGLRVAFIAIPVLGLFGFDLRCPAGLDPGGRMNAIDARVVQRMPAAALIHPEYASEELPRAD